MLHYRFVVTNTGNATLRFLTVDDATIQMNSYSCGNLDIAPGTSTTCLAPSTPSPAATSPTAPPLLTPPQPPPSPTEGTSSPAKTQTPQTWQPPPAPP
ncbi:DUF7507 domain-containing protein [Dermatophilus congolensis]|uniref:DUF7507 domain-containing protein n=1 Tax=Dermatophilus congolensis TaxID=1863 RepID=UPI000E0E9056